MSIQGKEEYLKIAQDIAAGGAGNDTLAGGSGQDEMEPVDTGTVLAEVEKSMTAEGIEEGSDSWYAERTNRIIEMVSPQNFAQMPAEEAFEALGMQISPEEIQVYNAADPETRLQMIDYINGNGGMGSLLEFGAETQGDGSGMSFGYQPKSSGMNQSTTPSGN